MKIYGDKQYLYQWDINQKVVVERLSAGDEVHYVISDDEVLVCSVYESNGLMMADIPNIILQSSGLIKTYEVKRADDGTNINTYRSAIRILERPRPTDYIYTETDTKNFHILSRQIDAAKETVIDFGKRLERVENLDHRLESLGIEVNEVLDGFEERLENSLSQIEYTLNTEYLPAIAKAQSTADSKLDKINPIGIGNLSMNRKTNSTVGSYSVAVGRDTEAAGESSLTEGQDTYAWGQAAHAEGYGTAALNMAAHAEGNDTVASGDYGAHAEGFMTTASGNDAHSQGYKTTASGQGSHAQGRETIASGRYAHSEGYGTDAASDMQHTQGRYNVRDTEHTYAHIVGNGTSDTKRSNAHTLDWEGNAWFAGTLKVGGAGQGDENAKEVALKDDITSIVESALTEAKESGQFDGANGSDYILTEADKQEIAEQAAQLVEVPEGGGGLTVMQISTLNNMFKIAAYTEDATAAYTAFKTAFGITEPDIPDEPDEPHTHNYTSEITTAATCTTAGVKTYTCSCGNSYTEEIPATGHNYVDGVCTVCGAVDPAYVPDVPEESNNLFDNPLKVIEPAYLGFYNGNIRYFDDTSDKNKILYIIPIEIGTYRLCANVNGQYTKPEICQNTFDVYTNLTKGGELKANAPTMLLGTHSGDYNALSTTYANFNSQEVASTSAPMREKQVDGTYNYYMDLTYDTTGWAAIAVSRNKSNSWSFVKVV